MSVILGAGAVFVAYATLSPAVWSRETFDLFPLGAAFAAGGNLAHEVSLARSRAQPYSSCSKWLKDQVVESLTYPAALVVISVLLSEVGPADNLSTLPQQMVFVLSCVMVISSVLWLCRSARRVRAVQDVEREGRLAEARAQARRNVAQFVHDVAAASPDRTAEPEEAATRDLESKIERPLGT